MLVYRFEDDCFCCAGCFVAYVYVPGSRSVSCVPPDSAAHPDPPPFFVWHVSCPYSVVMAHLIDMTDEPTLAACDGILVFFRQRLN